MSGKSGNSNPKSASSSVFDSRYARLNTEQKSAVDTTEGPVMVIAGPGTGKTSILTLRIANILRLTDTPPHGILAITYTNAGVKAMRLKLHEIIGNRAYEIAVHTFHSFASAMIGEYGDHFLHLKDLRPITDVEQESLIRAILAAPAFQELRPMGRPDAHILGIVSALSEAKRSLWSPETIRTFAKAEIIRIEKDPESISTRGVTKGKLKADALEKIEKCKRTLLFADIYAEYEEKKRAGNLMDFNDLINELRLALQQDELLLRLIQERFLYLHVDEHQDTNDSQNAIISLIAEFFDTPNLFIVGDEKQAIHRFQGASVENFMRLREKWPAMQTISLDTNYRSHQGILDASFSMIEHNYTGDDHKDLRVELKAGGITGENFSEKGKKGSAEAKPRAIDIVIGEDVAATESYLVRELKNISVEEPYATVAIISRRNRDVERVIRLLESSGIPVSSSRSVDIFHHPIGAIFFDLLEYLADPGRLDSLAKTIAAGMWNLPFDRAIPVIRQLRAGRTDGLDMAVPALSRLRKKILDDGAVGFLVRAADAEMSGFVSLLVRDPAYIHVWRGIITLAESLTRQNSFENPADLITAMLAYRQSAESKPVKVSVGSPDLPIQAMTAHASKGLEFDYVFIPYATDDAWVGRSRGSSFILPERKVSAYEVEDNRRLFYVALTRAKKHAVILAGEHESDGEELSPARFIEELNERNMRRVAVPRTEVQLPGINSGKGNGKDGDIKQPDKDTGDILGGKLVALAKEVLLDSGLSVTALNHFIKCQNEFLYQSILKLPQAPAPAAEKGNAMHLAISRVWNDESRLGGGSADEHIAKMTKIMSQAITEHIEQSFLSVGEKAAVIKTLTEDAPAVVKALAGHFSAPGPVATERWIKNMYHGSGSGSGSSVAIPVHGTLDAIVESGADVDVYDYKTRQALSPAAIKGETKSSDGGYFRQLIFYKMLLSEDHRWKGRKITPSLVFVAPDDKGRCPIVGVPVTTDDIATVKKHIQSVLDNVWSGEIARARCDERDCEWCGLREISKK